MKVALLGFGTVGKGVYDILSPREEFVFTSVACRPPYPDLPEQVCVTSDPLVAATDPQAELVVEVMGGIHPSLECVRAALEAGKHVVTANKFLIAQHYEELHRLAAEKGVFLRYSAAVGGGIPWLPSLERARRLGKVEEVWGVFNGTTNLILDAMTGKGSSYEDALQRAKDLGFAEADPSADVEGWDTRRKICISANVAFSTTLKEDDVPTAGITLTAAQDVAAAKKMGCVPKLMGRAMRVDGGVAAWVEVAFVPAASREGVIEGGDNVISYRAEYVGEESFFGPGAGRYPTGFAVAQDCLDLALGNVLPSVKRFDALPSLPGQVAQRYYCRPIAPAPDLEALAERRLGEGFLTRPMPVAEMHALAKGRAFFAAVYA